MYALTTASKKALGVASRRRQRRRAAAQKKVSSCAAFAVTLAGFVDVFLRRNTLKRIGDLVMLQVIRDTWSASAISFVLALGNFGFSQAMTDRLETPVSFASSS